MVYKFSPTTWILTTSIVIFLSCSKKNGSATTAQPRDPATATVTFVDRFSASAGHLQVRNSTNNLPGPNLPINLDEGPFITKGLGPNGQLIEYYNLDLRSSTPAPIYVLFREGSNAPVNGQLNIINLLPGEPGYNDFWLINKVTVPANYIANTITSYAEITANGYTITPTKDLVNCPVVPKGSIASKTFGSTRAQSLATGWYKDQVVYYFSFNEKGITTTADGLVPTIPIYVSFNINPDQPNGGPPSGFVTEAGSAQTHNVISGIPSDTFYTPLWIIDVYDNANFGAVKDLKSAQAANVKATGAGFVNCPIVSLQ